MAQGVQPYTKAERLLNLLMALRGSEVGLVRAQIRSVVRGYNPDASSEAFDRAFDQTRGLLDQRIITQVGELLGAFVLRRMKAQVLSRLPPKAEVAIFAPMSFTQLEMTKELLQ